jgi:hypothetical protein
LPACPSANLIVLAQVCLQEEHLSGCWAVISTQHVTDVDSNQQTMVLSIGLAALRARPFTACSCESNTGCYLKVTNFSLSCTVNVFFVRNQKKKSKPSCMFYIPFHLYPTKVSLHNPPVFLLTCTYSLLECA